MDNDDGDDTGFHLNFGLHDTPSDSHTFDNDDRHMLHAYTSSDMMLGGHDGGGYAEPSPQPPQPPQPTSAPPPLLPPLLPMQGGGGANADRDYEQAVGSGKDDDPIADFDFSFMPDLRMTEGEEAYMRQESSYVQDEPMYDDGVVDDVPPAAWAPSHPSMEKDGGVSHAFYSASFPFCPPAGRIAVMVLSDHIVPLAAESPSAFDALTNEMAQATLRATCHEAWQRSIVVDVFHGDEGLARAFMPGPDALYNEYTCNYLRLIGIAVQNIVINGTLVTLTLLMDGAEVLFTITRASFLFCAMNAFGYTGPDTHRTRVTHVQFSQVTRQRGMLSVEKARAVPGPMAPFDILLVAPALWESPQEVDDHVNSSAELSVLWDTTSILYGAFEKLWGRHLPQAIAAKCIKYNRGLDVSRARPWFLSSVSTFPAGWTIPARFAEVASLPTELPPLVIETRTLFYTFLYADDMDAPIQWRLMISIALFRSAVTNVPALASYVSDVRTRAMHPGGANVVTFSAAPRHMRDIMWPFCATNHNVVKDASNILNSLVPLEASACRIERVNIEHLGSTRVQGFPQIMDIAKALYAMRHDVTFMEALPTHLQIAVNMLYEVRYGEVGGATVPPVIQKAEILTPAQLVTAQRNQLIQAYYQWFTVRPSQRSASNPFSREDTVAMAYMTMYAGLYGVFVHVTVNMHMPRALSENTQSPNEPNARKKRRITNKSQVF